MLAPRYMVPVLTSEHRRRFAVEGARVPFTVAMTFSRSSPVQPGACFTRAPTVERRASGGMVATFRDAS